MQKIFFLIVASFFLMACPSEKIDPNIYEKDYGEGIYALTSNGVNYFDPKQSELKQNIFSTVNGQYISNLSSFNLIGKDMYIVSENTLYLVDVETFLKDWELSGFVNAQNCEYAKFDRLYVSDKGESEIKVVDLNTREITAHVRTGESVNPTEIVLTWERAFVANSGGEESSDYDSTIVAIDLKEGLAPVNNFAGNILVDKNPVSLIHNGAMVVLCKGVYDEIDPTNNVESSICLVGTGSLNAVSSTTLNGLYNADNLILNNSETKYYITSSLGVYYLSVSSLNKTLVTDKKIPTVLEINRESFANTDTTSLIVDFLYMNDENKKDYIYKYNVYLNQFVDSFQVDSDVIDLEVY
jgi:hypothetical protein